MENKEYEKVNDHEKRITLLEENDKVQNKRLDAHGQQIDSIILANANQNKNYELMKKDLESIKRTNEKVEDKLDKVIQKPLMTADRIKTTVLGLIIGFLVTLLLKSLFPHI